MSMNMLIFDVYGALGDNYYELSYHCVDFVITGVVVGCHNGDLRCHRCQTRLMFYNATDSCLAIWGVCKPGWGLFIPKIRFRMPLSVL